MKIPTDQWREMSKLKKKCPKFTYNDLEKYTFSRLGFSNVLIINGLAAIGILLLEFAAIFSVSILSDSGIQYANSSFLSFLRFLIIFPLLLLVAFISLSLIQKWDLSWLINVLIMFVLVFCSIISFIYILFFKSNVTNNYSPLFTESKFSTNAANFEKKNKCCGWNDINDKVQTSECGEEDRPCKNVVGEIVGRIRILMTVFDFAAFCVLLYTLFVTYMKYTVKVAAYEPLSDANIAYL